MFKTAVALTYGDNPKNRVEKAISLLGGMKKFISQGQTVLIKPNLVFPEPPPKTTDPSTIASLIKMVIKAGAGRVLVGESPSSGERKARGLTSREVFEETGVGQMVKDLGGEVLLFDQSEVVDVNISSATLYKKAKIYRAFLEADVVISVPVLKTHFLTDVTLGIKNLYGFVAQEHRKLYHRDDINQKLVDLLRLRCPDLTVIDGGLCMEGLGPSAGKPVRMDVTIAGEDVVACDAVGASLMMFDPMQIDHIRMADHNRLGIGRLEDIRVIGEDLEPLKKHFQKPDLRITGMFKGVEVIEGGVCRECRGRTRWILDELENRGLLAKLNPLTVIVGVKPYIPDLKILPGGNLMVVGDCALQEFNKQKQEVTDNIFLAKGCPPASAPRIAPAWAEGVIKAKKD